LLDPIQARDGAEAVRWAAALPHSSGKVGGLGASYLGIMQLLTAAAVGPDSPLKAILPIVPSESPYRDLFAPGGLLKMQFTATWVGQQTAFGLGVPLLEGRAPGNAGTSVQNAANVLDFATGLFQRAYLNDGPEAHDEAYWKAREPRSMVNDIVRNRVAAFIVGAWHDVFQRGEPLLYGDLQNALAGRPVGGPMPAGAPVSGRYQLLMGPWYHLTAGLGFDLDDVELEWFDTWLKGADTGMDRTPTPLHLNELGTDRYMGATSYPLEHATPTTYYLARGGELSGGSPAPSGGEDTIAWSGLSQTCTLSGEQNGALGGNELILNGLGSSSACGHNDASGPGSLTYTTAPFAKPTVLAGPIDATLFASSTTKESEWIVNVSRVGKDGKAMALTFGNLLGSLRALDPGQTWTAPDGRPLLPYHPFTIASQRAVEPGKVTRYDIEIAPTFARVGPGERLGLTIATSDLPVHLPPLPRLRELLGGTYRVQHNSAAASFVELPLAPEGAFPADSAAGPAGAVVRGHHRRHATHRCKRCRRHRRHRRH
jgi:putative CocE/NonD family hydrolase